VRDQMSLCRVLLPILVLAGCRGTPQPPIKLHTLPSGEQVKVLGIRKITSSASGPALMLRYQTDMNMDDANAVHAEAERIWADFRKDAEQAHVQSAIISANSPPSGGGVITHTRAYNFVFERRGTGDWREVRAE
jgi:hypothetical protein